MVEVSISLHIQIRMNFQLSLKTQLTAVLFCLLSGLLKLCCLLLFLMQCLLHGFD